MYETFSGALVLYVASVYVPPLELSTPAPSMLNVRLLPYPISALENDILPLPSKDLVVLPTVIFLAFNSLEAVEALP